MKTLKLDLIPREAFSALSLTEKNTYLQGVATTIAQAHGETGNTALDKDSLSRLRRFYMRRRANELELEKVSDPIIRKTLTRYSEAIHLGEVKLAIAHATPSAPKPTFRAPPPDDAQLMFFVPTVHDAPLKDDINLMDVAPFSLSKTVRQGVIHYELPDCHITIEGGAEVGLVTAYDYDIFLHMVSHLAWQMRQYRLDESRGLRPSLPPKTYRPNASDILKFCRREQGGKQYQMLERALDRLGMTRYKITNLNADGKRRADSFPLIGAWSVISRTRNDTVDEISIEIPDWVYKGVVTSGESPSILTLNPDYFLLAKPLAKFLYRLARKACGKHGIAEYNLETLYARSGSEMPFGKFRESIRDIVEQSNQKPLPDFNLEIVGARNGEKLRMMERKKQVAMQKAA